MEGRTILRHAAGGEHEDQECETAHARILARMGPAAKDPLPGLGSAGMYTLTITDYLKCAHSLKGEIFGPAQLMHVSTFDVEVAFTKPDVDEHGILVDFAAAQQGLAAALAPLRFKNLDDVAEVKGINTTTENLCKYLHDRIRKSLGNKFRGLLKVTMHEGRVASASYEAQIA